MSQIAITPSSKAASNRGTRTATSARRWPKSLIAIAAVLIAAGGVYLYAAKPFSAAGGVERLTTVPVRQGPFDVRVTVKGELAAVENIDISCNVEGTSTITQLIDEGSQVKKGQTLAVLDSSAIRQKLEDAEIDLQRATADVTSATELLAIQESQNAANIEADTVAEQLAKIDLTKYIEGDYPNLLEDARMALEKTATGLRTAKEELSQTQSLFSKGFVTASEVKTKELDVAAAERDVTKATSSRDVLVKYSHVADLTAKKNVLVQAEQKLSRTRRENTANLSQKQADLRAKQQQLDVITRRVKRYREQIANCTIVAPADGLVVYQNGNGRDRADIQEGAQVRDRQVLMKLPDTSHMKIVFKANENQVTQIKIGMPVTVDLSSGGSTLTGKVTKISPVSDSTNRWLDPDRKEYPVDVVLEQTPEGLKPGMTGQASVLVDHVGQTLAIPLSALYTAGSQRYAFVATDDADVKPAEVTLGRLNAQDVEVVKGLSAGQSVVLLQPGQGKLFLSRTGEPQRKQE